MDTEKRLKVGEGVRVWDDAPEYFNEDEDAYESHGLMLWDEHAPSDIARMLIESFGEQKANEIAAAIRQRLFAARMGKH